MEDKVKDDKPTVRDRIVHWTIWAVIMFLFVGWKEGIFASCNSYNADPMSYGYQKPSEAAENFKNIFPWAVFCISIILVLFLNYKADQSAPKRSYKYVTKEETNTEQEDTEDLEDE